MTLTDLAAEIAAALRPIAAEIPDLQVYQYWNDNPTPPALDLYPAVPFQVGDGFNIQQRQVFFTVRARVAMADPEAAQQSLLRMLDPGDPASVEAALDPIGVHVPLNAPVDGYRQYSDDASAQERMLGCEWTVSAFL